MSALVVVGASAAGVAAAEGARASGFEGSITLVGAEPHAPYERPPLSKSLLAPGTVEPKLLLPAARLATLDVTLLLGHRATALDPAARTVDTTAGLLPADAGVVLAMGVRARTLSVPGADGPGVVYLRTLDDALLLKRSLQDSSVPVVVIGAGFIGLEVAAVARAHGASVTVLEAADAALLRGGGAAVGEWFVARHRAQGVDVRTSVTVQRFVRDAANQVQSVELADGSSIEAGLVIVGVGVTPATELADAIGIEVADGIVVDPTGRSSNPWVYAAGDVARHAQRGGRIEHWNVASEQGHCAGASIVGAATPWNSVPYFWSEQYDSMLQLFGRPAVGDELVVRSDDGTSVCWVWLRDGQVSAVGGVGVPREIRAGRDLIARGVRPDPLLLRDPNTPLRSLSTPVDRRVDATSAVSATTSVD